MPDGSPLPTTGAETRGDALVSDLQQWPCPTCEHDTDFEQPECIDGHTEDGGACPEWACTDCGTALVSGDVHRPAAATWRHAA